MHSRIIQIADSPIDKENFLDEDSIETGPNSLVDYTAEISEKERQLAIENLVNHWLPKGMFSLGTEPDTIVYNGGMDDWLAKSGFPKSVRRLKTSAPIMCSSLSISTEWSGCLTTPLTSARCSTSHRTTIRVMPKEAPPLWNTSTNTPRGTFSTSAGCLTIIGNHKIYLQYETLDNNIKGTKPS